MSSRTRSHILEDESRNHFKLSIPTNWVIRDKPNDYGIDLEVEIFDAKGAPTGLVFWVQLKATDANDVKIEKSINIPRSKIGQLFNYSLPVMLVRYSSTQKIFYWKWVRNVAFFNTDNHNKYIKVVFQEYDKWTDGTPKLIESYMRKSKSVSNGEFNLPIKLYIHFDELKFGITNLLNLKSHLSAYKSILSIERNVAEAELIAYFTETKVLLSLLDQRGVSLSIDKFDPGNFQPDKFSMLILIGLLVILANHKRHDLFNRLIEIPKVLSSLKEMPQIFQSLIPFLLQGSNFKTNLNLVLDLVDTSENVEADIITVCHILNLQAAATPRETETILTYYNRRIEKARQGKEKKSLGIALYNLSNFHHAQGNIKDAITCLNQARKEYPPYAKKGYFLREIASNLFEIEKFKLASHYYGRAIQSGEAETAWFYYYADALMFSGQYEKAINEFDRYLQKATQKSSDFHEAQLKYSCLTTLIENGYPKTQLRSPSQALQKADPTTKEDETLEENLQASLDVDLLCALAWFNLGQLHAKKERYKESFFAFLMSGILNRNDVISWVNATLITLNTDEGVELFIHLVNTANIYCGDAFLANLSQILPEGSGSSRAEFIELVNSVIHEQSKPKNEIRFIGENAEVNSFLL